MTGPAGRTWEWSSPATRITELARSPLKSRGVVADGELGRHNGLPVSSIVASLPLETTAPATANSRGNLAQVDYAALLLEQNRAFSELIRGADDSTPVPTCPGWRLGQLIRHVGRGDRWAAQIVRDQLDHFLDPRSVEDGKPPPEPDGVVSWVHGGALRLVEAVEQVGVESPVWTFLGTRPANWWIRRRLHEVAVHRADATIALGCEFTLEADLAADAISEWLERVAIQAGSNGAALPLDADTTMHLHATDPDLGAAGEWTIHVSGPGITWSHEHGKGSVALRGGATELLLALVRRVSVTDTGIQMFGDDTVWRRWLERTPL